MNGHQYLRDILETSMHGLQKHITRYSLGIKLEKAETISDLKDILEEILDKEYGPDIIKEKELGTYI
jgi:hypothetical protein